MTPVKGWLPDADPSLPGIITDCQHLQPTATGYMAAPSPVNAAVDTLPAACRGAVVATMLNGTRRVIAGTQTDLLQLAGNAWQSFGKAGGYVGSSESRWSYAQFGDTTLATNLADPMQESGVVSNHFADVPTAPKAKIIVSASNNFVLAFFTNEGTYGVAPDRWWCCAQNNQNDWVPNVSTGANTGRLIATQGPLTAALPLGDYVVAYKASAVFVGVFVGSPVGFQWNHIPGGPCGCIGQEALCDIGGAHFVIAEDGFWIFDGTRPLPIGAGENRMWWLNNSNVNYRYRTQCVFDQRANLVRIYYCSVNNVAGTLDACVTYSVLSKQWGRDDRASEAAMSFIRPGTTINGWDSFAATIDALPNIPVDSPYWLQAGRTPAYFDTTHTLMSLNGTPTDSSMTTGDLGDDDTVTMIERFRIRFTTTPASAVAQGLVKFNEGDTLVPGPVNAINDGKFDLRQTGRYHRVRVDMTGTQKFVGFDAKPIPTGMR